MYLATLFIQAISSKWFKYGLKSQKFLEAIRPERAEAPSPGHALGIIAISKAPCKGKSFDIARYLKAFALTGRQVCDHNYPGRCPGLGASALSGRVGQNLRKFSYEFLHIIKGLYATFSSWHIDPCRFPVRYGERGCVISLDNGSQGRAESPKAPSPGHRPG